MSTRNALPELLLPYLQPPSQGSLILATYVLGATNNWLLLRYLKACLDGKSTVRQQDADGSSPAPEHEEAKDVSVVLVSWMREFDFWRTEARKAVGLDLAKVQQQGRLIFIDGLTGQPPSDNAAMSMNQAPVRRPTPPPTAQAPPSPLIARPSADGNTRCLADLRLTTLETAIHQSLNSLPPSTQAVLVLDTPSLPISLLPDAAAQTFSKTLMSLRSHSRLRSAIVSVPADDPFTEAAKGTWDARYKHGITPLDAETAAFMAQCVSQSQFVISCRRLGTGWAKDVSGVLRVTRGGCADEEEDSAILQQGASQHLRRTIEEGEWLYHVAGDGSARVWVRGSATA